MLPHADGVWMGGPSDWVWGRERSRGFGRVEMDFYLCFTTLATLEVLLNNINFWPRLRPLTRTLRGLGLGIGTVSGLPRRFR